jgi:hypothetical protein
VATRTAVTATQRERSRQLVEQLVSKGRRAARDDILALVHAIKESPEQNRRMYRLLALNGMVGVGLGSEQIANELGISARHVRRLADRSPFLVVRKALFKKTARTEVEARKRTRCIVAELRAMLLEGLVHHSDRGVQHLAIRYTERLAEAGAVRSVGSRGDTSLTG